MSVKSRAKDSDLLKSEHAHHFVSLETEISQDQGGEVSGW
ncbi:hypothetical protein Enr17x_12480 [Gimesia fumaroli]|uniref:Uncharacterized protein n=1 Tax=Gimesia fumaroli TaxID=2527976 RepID=A0A518I800_9PLAN|nr:hypothetical protein Enr17x_12480 [Gimesia fumaroli]